MSLSSDLAIQLGENEYPLKSSLKAATAVSDRFGGFSGAKQAVARDDLSALTFVVRQGVPLKAISSDALAEAVYERGTRALMPTVLKFIGRLANGGRDPDLDAEAGEEEGAEGNGD